jgi:hypothetical protein
VIWPSFSFEDLFRRCCQAHQPSAISPSISKDIYNYLLIRSFTCHIQSIPARSSSKMANELYADEFYDKAIRAAVSSTLISKKGNVCPFAIRLAWHSSGTFDKDDKSPNSGGSDGATMRFEDELSNPANAGLGIVQGILGPLKQKFPDVSVADLWVLAGVQAIKLCGGPEVPFSYGRTDAPDSSTCAPHGRLPDGDKGAQHLRDIFYRMG